MWETTQVSAESSKGKPGAFSHATHPEAFSAVSTLRRGGGRERGLLEITQPPQRALDNYRMCSGDTPTLSALKVNRSYASELQDGNYYRSGGDLIR